MLTIKIQSYRKNNQLPAYHFFVLCKGNNSGRPSRTPNANSFVVSAPTAEDIEHLYWLSYAIWKGRGFEPLLRGSVIPFITTRDYRRHLAASHEKATGRGLPLGKIIEAMQLLNKKEDAARAQIKALTEMRQLLLRKFLPG